ncbi:DUF1636 family protein [Shimia abyssi]|uniref:Putative metal-binding protein n=1 Tax=Shimia abyssi TaxID=1662395 RepID=A0A2P8F7X2_9RHOB|nr:DUF1636 family protein [Shimia abyssi]PSL17815.1 putative metal-binding protein [Shimia abyssi]
MNHIIFVCDTCCANGEKPGGEGFAAALREAAPDDVEVRSVSCLNMCDEPLALALRASDKVAYLFAGVNPETDVADALELIRLYRTAPGGVIEDARSVGRLRFCLKGRIPAL